MPPAAQYADRIFTTGEVGVEGSPHIPKKDFGPLIERWGGAGRRPSQGSRCAVLGWGRAGARVRCCWTWCVPAWAAGCPF
jgi:hypothetical protein